MLPISLRMNENVKNVLVLQEKEKIKKKKSSCYNLTGLLLPNLCLNLTYKIILFENLTKFCFMKISNLGIK